MILKSTDSKLEVWPKDSFLAGNEGGLRRCGEEGGRRQEGGSRRLEVVLGAPGEGKGEGVLLAQVLR